MSDHDQERAGEQSANLARHLSGQHPETFLLLARHAPGGRPDVIEAELTGADEGGLTPAPPAGSRSQSRSRSAHVHG